MFYRLSWGCHKRSVGFKVSAKENYFARKTQKFHMGHMTFDRDNSGYNTRYNDNLHLLSTGLTLVQKGVAYSGCKIYNHLPPQIKKILNNITLFKTTLKKLLLQYIFYSVDEYFQQNCNDYDYK